jgi:hypothetical protein
VARCRRFYSTRFQWLVVLFQMTFFGTVYYQIAGATSDFGGLQSFVSVIFMGGIYVASPVQVFALPNLFKERGVFYRERAASTYLPEVYPLAFVVAELPWLWLCTWCAVTVRRLRHALARSTQALMIFCSLSARSNST